MRLLTTIAITCAFAVSASAQSFTLTDETGPSWKPSADVVFTITKPAQKLNFVFIPPARKMFVDLAGTVSLFPALYPHSIHFEKVSARPAFLADRFSGSFSVYRVGKFYLALDEGYTLHSATIRNGKLFVMAKDADGDFVALNRSHFAIYGEDGAPQQAREITGQPGNISVLVDRSGSMQGFDAEVGDALKSLSTTLVTSDYCALYEFGQKVKVVRKPMTQTCGDLFARYSISAPRGGTPLFSTMYKAYSDLQNTDAVTAVIILSDGEPSDAPDPNLKTMAGSTPTFVLWVGDHSTNYLAAYSTAHAMSRAGASAEIADFLRAISFSVKGHQTFGLTP